MYKIWMIRAGKNGKYFNDFISNGIVAIGLDSLGEIDKEITKEEIINRYKILNPSDSYPQVRISALQIYRFFHDISVGDTVLTYDKENRIYEIGIIKSDVLWNPKVISELPNIRHVRWEKTVPRDMINSKYRTSLGALLTLFEIKEHVMDDILKHAQPI